MVKMNSFAKISDLKLASLFKLLEDHQTISTELSYDPDFDALIILFNNYQNQYIAHPVDEFVSLLYEPDTKEVIGIQVEAFEQSFIHRYASVEKAWKLSDNCADFQHQDIGDIYIMLEKRRPVIVHEVSRITNDLLFSNNHALSLV